MQCRRSTRLYCIFNVLNALEVQTNLNERFVDTNSVGWFIQFTYNIFLAASEKRGGGGRKGIMLPAAGMVRVWARFRI